MRDNSEILDNPVNSSLAERLKATEDFRLTERLKACMNLNLSLNVIYENGVFLAVFYYPLLVECIIVLFFRNINC